MYDPRLRSVKIIQFDFSPWVVELILRHQYFLYDNQLYQQTAGAPLNYPLTRTLANIYLFYLLNDLVFVLHEKKEIFCRSSHQLIDTWNGSKDELQKLLEQTIVRCFSDVSTRIVTSMSDTVRFGDAIIGHDQDVLQTTVYHESQIEPYTLPFVYDTTKREDYPFLFRAALIHAALYCSSVDDFENERFNIDWSFLINNAT